MNAEKGCLQNASTISGSIGPARTKRFGWNPDVPIVIPGELIYQLFLPFTIMICIFFSILFYPESFPLPFLQISHISYFPRAELQLGTYQYRDIAEGPRYLIYEISTNNEQHSDNDLDQL